MHRASRFALIALTASCLLPASASADSLLYAKDDNVWLATPDGARQVQVTGGGGYERPSQADDGTILALRRVPRPNRSVPPRELVRMDRSGQLLNTPFFPLGPDAEVSYYGGPLDERVSADGRRVAYMYNYSGPLLAQGPRFSITWSDRYTPRSTWTDSGGYLNPFWVDNDRVGVFPTSLTADVQVYDTVSDAFTDWFEDPGLDLGGGEMDPTGSALAAAGFLESDASSVIRLYSLNGPPPAEPTPRCELQGPVGTFFRPTFSPDGRSLAWQEDDGIHVGSFDLTTCEGSERLVVPGGLAPDWGPADVPAPAAAGAGSGTQAPAGAQVPTSTATAGSGALQTSLTAAKRVTLARLIAGLTVTVSCSRACEARLSILADRALAKRLKLRGTGVVAKASRRLAMAGSARLRLKPSTKLRKRLRAARPKKLTVKATAVAGTERKTSSRVVRVAR